MNIPELFSVECSMLPINLFVFTKESEDIRENAYNSASDNPEFSPRSIIHSQPWRETMTEISMYNDMIPSKITTIW